MHGEVETVQNARGTLSGECCRWVMDGVLLMVDIPGFTALSERLTREGPRGMETLARLLETFLQRTLQVLDDTGGIPLKFGGDAVIGAFYGPGGMERAREAAHRLLQVLPSSPKEEEDVPALPSPKVAVARGAWLETWLGDEAWQDRFVEGPAVRRLMELDAQGVPGEVQVDPTADPAPWGEPRLEAMTFPEARAEEGDGNGGVRLIRIREEHRVASVVFLQLYRYRTWPPELDRLRRTVAHVARHVRARGGTLTRLFPHRRGQHLLLLFGIPRAGEDDPYRAVRTALELVRELEYPRYVRAGVASGWVMTGRLALGSTGGEYTVLGDVVNVSARLMERARRHEVCVDEATRVRTQERVRFRPLAWLNLKGKRSRIAVYQALRLQPIQTWYAHPLVGREREHARLRAAVQSGGVLAVLGPPGIGKTRLVQELERLEEVQARRLLRVRVEQDGMALFRDLVWTWASVRPGMPVAERRTRILQAFQRAGIPHAEAYAAFLERVWEETDAESRTPDVGSPGTELEFAL